MDLAIGRPRDRGRGFSLIETLISAGILLIIILGLLPLFTRATINNKKGSQSTAVANFARAAVEELVQLPFESPLLTITTGAENVIIQKYLHESKQWVPDSDPPVAGDPATWTRTVTVRQYAWAAVQQAGADPDLLTIDVADALAAGAAGDVVLKEIVVEVERVDTTATFGAPELTVRTFKSE